MGGINMFLEDLKSYYNAGEPIFIKDVLSFFDNKKEVTIRKQFQRLSEDNKLINAGNGTYFFPIKNSLGDLKSPDFNDVLNKKYIDSIDGNKRGYYSGLTLMNKLGLSYQIPNIKEITTNIEKSRRRVTSIMGRKVILRKPRTEINKNNVFVLEFLDLITVFGKYLDIEEKEALKIISTYYKSKGVTFKGILSYLKYYPALTSKKIWEYKIYDEFTSR